MERTLLFDFDSTWTRVEALDLLAQQLADEGRLSRTAVTEIANVTELGMNGAIGFGESLRRRMAVLDIHADDITTLSHTLKAQVSNSIVANADWVRANAHRIRIVSNGFVEFIAPVVAELGIAEGQVVANRFLLNTQGRITGADLSSPLAADNGKPVAVQALNLTGEVWAIGDGFTDYQIKQGGAAHAFVAYTENVRRQRVVDLADFEAPSLDVLIAHDARS